MALLCSTANTGARGSNLLHSPPSCLLMVFRRRRTPIPTHRHPQPRECHPSLQEFGFDSHTLSRAATASSMPKCTGNTYTAGEGDTCQSIAESNSIATDRLIAANALDYNCTTLRAGLDLCVESTCTLHTVEVNETCSDLTQGETFSILQLTS
jgi:hypothetical protein